MIPTAQSHSLIIKIIIFLDLYFLGWTTQTPRWNMVTRQGPGIFSGRLWSALPCHSGIKITKLPNKSDCSCLRRSIYDEMESLAVVIPGSLEIEECKSRNSLIPVKAVSKAMLPSVPDAKSGKTTEICQISAGPETRREKLMSIPVSFPSLCTWIIWKQSNWVDSRRGSLWLCNVLWGYLLAADFPGWKDVEQYLLNYCQILFMRPNCIIVPGNRPRSCKDHHPRHICSNPEVSCSLQMGQRLVMVWDSASKIAVKVTNWARTHDLWRCSSCGCVWLCCVLLPRRPPPPYLDIFKIRRPRLNTDIHHLRSSITHIWWS